MAKLTRKSYKRKKVAFAAILLGGVALVSSGFAAWVLSAQADQKNPGSVNVATVVNGALDMKVYKYASTGSNTLLDKDASAGYYSFNADSKDIENKGSSTNRFYYGTNAELGIEGDELPELLYNTYVIEITSKADSLSSLMIKFEVDKESEKTTLTTLKDEDFIELPESFDGKEFKKDSAWKDSSEPNDLTVDGANSLKVVSPTDSDGNWTWTFTYTVAFAWGGRFNSKNPCWFFDEEATSKDTTSVRTKSDDTGITYGKGYGTEKGKDVKIDVIDEDMAHFHEIDKVSYTLTFTATGL